MTHVTGLGDPGQTYGLRRAPRAGRRERRDMTSGTSLRRRSRICRSTLANCGVKESSVILILGLVIVAALVAFLVMQRKKESAQ